MNKKIFSTTLTVAIATVMLIVSTLAISVFAWSKTDLLTEAAKSPIYKHVREAVEIAAEAVSITDEQAEAILPYVTTAVEAVGHDRGDTIGDETPIYPEEEYSVVIGCISDVCEILGWNYGFVPSDDPQHDNDVVFNVYGQDGSVIFSYDGDKVERAKGIVFKADSGYTANTYTGYVGGVELGTTAETVLAALENSLGVEIRNDDYVLGATDVVKTGDKIVATNEDGIEVAELEVIIMGDVNGDGAVNTADVTSALKAVAKWDVSINEVAADTNGNGTVDMLDVMALLKYVADWDVEFTNNPVLPGVGNNSVKKVIQTFAPGVSSNINLRKGQDLAVKFSVEEGKYAKSIKANYPSWGDSKGSIRLSLYKWNTDYETTIAAAPIYTEKYENFADNAEIIFSLTDAAGKGVGEGEYLWRIYESYDERVNPDDATEPVGVGMWTYKCPVASTGVTVFFEGVAMDPAAADSFGPEAYISIGD